MKQSQQRKAYWSSTAQAWDVPCLTHFRYLLMKANPRPEFQMGEGAADSGSLRGPWGPRLGGRRSPAQQTGRPQNEGPRPPLGRPFRTRLSEGSRCREEASGLCHCEGWPATLSLQSWTISEAHCLHFLFKLSTDNQVWSPALGAGPHLQNQREAGFRGRTTTEEGRTRSPLPRP